MTRHTLLKEKSGGETKEIVVGWDNPLNTYFLQVMISDSIRDVVYDAIGERPNEYKALKPFVDACMNKGYELGPDIVSKLKNDKNTALPHTELQKRMLRILDSMNKG